MELKREDFSEETIYVIKCPTCENIIETSEDPTYNDVVQCDECLNVYKLID